LCSKNRKLSTRLWELKSITYLHSYVIHVTRRDRVHSDIAKIFCCSLNISRAHALVPHTWRLSSTQATAVSTDTAVLKFKASYSHCGLVRTGKLWLQCLIHKGIKRLDFWSSNPCGDKVFLTRSYRSWGPHFRSIGTRSLSLWSRAGYGHEYPI